VGREGRIRRTADRVIDGGGAAELQKEGG